MVYENIRIGSGKENRVAMVIRWGLLPGFTVITRTGLEKDIALVRISAVVMG